MGDLCVDDLRNLAKYFPTDTDEGKPAWAIAGGGAIMCFATGKVVSGRQHRDVSYGDRYHKDLDVFAFDMCGCRLPHGLAHEIYRVAFYQEPHRCNYHDRDPNLTGFFFEVLQDNFFGYRPPRQEDVVRVEVEGSPFWALSPEYILATRFYHALPLRPEDASDTSYLLRAFDVDALKLGEAVRRGPWAEVATAGSISDEMLVELMTARDGIRRAEELTQQTVMQRFPFLRDSIDPNDLRTFLFLEKAMLTEEEFTHLYARAEKCLNRFKGSSKTETAAVALTLCMERAARTPVALERIIQESGLVRMAPASALRFSVQLFRGLKGLEATGFFTEGHLLKLSRRVVEEFYQTAFFNVLLSSLEAMPARLNRAPNLKAKVAVFESFTQLLGWRSWRKEMAA